MGITKGKKLIIGAFSTIAIIIVVILGIVIYFSKGEANTKGADNATAIKKGEVELVYTSKNNISTHYGNNFRIEKDGEDITIDAEGNTVLQNDLYLVYTDLENGYFSVTERDGNKIKVFNRNKEIFSSSSANSIVCGNNVLYYIDIDSNYNYTIVAYDFKNQKELWRKETERVTNLYYADNYIKMMQLENETFDAYNKLTYSKIINLDGETIAESTEDYNIYATSSNYYIKLKEKEYVQVYDLNNNKISEISLKEDNDTYYELQDVLPNGMYIIYKSEKTETKYVYEYTYKLYNIKSELIKESDKTISRDTKSNLNASIVNTDGDDILLKKDGTGILAACNDIGLGKGIYDYTSGIIKDYIVLEKYPENDIIVNLNNEKMIDMPIEQPSDSFSQSPNGDYIILYDKDNVGSYSYVYDGEWNKIHETSNYLVTINDEYVLEMDSETDQLYILNVFTGAQKAIDTKGQYAYLSNEYGIITQDEENYYLYAFK